MNFLRDLFGVQTVKVAGEELPASKTVSFEGAVSGDFDPDTQEILLTFGPLPVEDRPVFTGVGSTQAQINEIVAALVSLGLMLDGRA